MNAQDAPVLATSTATPRLALVIGSGGVRGASAIGVVDVLARAGLRPDLIVGCSSGALFGAGLALGLSSDMLMRLVTTMWTPRLTQQRRWQGYAQLVAPRLARFNNDFSLRRADPIVQTLEAVFRDLTLEQLRLPLRVAATDAISGAPVVLRRGPIVGAVQASMAVPFLWPSVEIDGRRLVDGAVSDPLPVAAAGDAHVVLALGFRGDLPRRVLRPASLVAQVSTAMLNNLYDARLAAARARGRSLIELAPVWPRRIGLWETRALPEAFQAGRHAALACLPAIERALARPPQRQAA
jgi:NTE family protein